MTVKPVIPRGLAHHDVDDAIDYYLADSAPQAAEGFIDEVEQAFARIGRQPGVGSPRYGHELEIPGLRAWPLKRYPYLVFYMERPDYIDVWRILHTRRDIPAWLGPPEAE